jgi:hypothetical protein
MRRSIREGLILVGAFILTGATAWGQQTRKPAPASVDLAITYSPERAQIVPDQCCFWMQGGAADAAATFWKGFGIAASLTGEHASNYLPAMSVHRIAFLAGPRYTYTAWASHAGSAAESPFIQVFGQGLFGGAHGYDGVYPSGSGTTSIASSSAIEVGGGFNLFFTRSVGVRLLEVDYVRTALPNNSTNAQDDMRLAFGVAFRFDSVSSHHR